MSVVKALNVLAPKFDKTVPASAFRYDYHNGRAPQYAAQIAFTGHPPRDTVLIDAEELREACDEIVRLIAERDALRVIAQDFDEVLREKNLRCECGEADCRTTRLDAALARIGGES